MKRLILAAMIAATAFASLCAGPAIKWLGTHHDFGPIDENAGTASVEFFFVNTGDEPLVITSARASCGCTTPLYPTQAIAPGDTASVSVAYNPEGRPGRFNKSVTVESNAGSKSRLTIRGTVIGSSATVSSRYPHSRRCLSLRHAEAMAGELARPRLKTVYIDAYNMSHDSIRPRVVRSPRWCDMVFEPKTAPPGQQTTMIFYFRASDAPDWGPVEDSIVVAAADTVFAIPVSMTVVETFTQEQILAHDAPVASLSTRTVDMGIMDGAEPWTGVFTVTNTGRHPLSLRTLYADRKGVEATASFNSLKKGHSGDVTVTVTPEAIVDGILNATVTLMTDDPANPRQTVRIVGQLRK